MGGWLLVMTDGWYATLEENEVKEVEKKAQSTIDVVVKTTHLPE